MAQGTVLLVNGASSSGKTSFARALQAIWGGPLLLVGIDMVISMLPFAYTGDGEHATDGFALTDEGDDAGPLRRLALGTYGRSLNRHLSELAARLAADGFDVLIDHVILDDDTLNELVRTLPHDRTWFIGVHCEPGELARRELRRGDRLIGTARAQAEAVHARSRLYDLELDATSTAPGALAATAKAALAVAPTALRTLAERLARNAPSHE